MVRALGLAPPTGRAVLEATLGCSTIDEACAARCRDIVAGSGALASVEATIDIHLARAVQLAAAFDEPTRTQLTVLAQYAARRDR